MPPTRPLICAWCDQEIRVTGSGNQRTQETRPLPDDLSADATRRTLADAPSHGICVECLGGALSLPVLDVHRLDRERADELPYGLIRLDHDGVVRGFNRWESDLARLDREAVLGRDFFREVAPCADTDAFGGRFRSLVARGGGREDFEYVFRFPWGSQHVRVQMVVDGQRPVASLRIERLG